MIEHVIAVPNLPPAPASLREPGRALWEELTAAYDFRIDGLRVLEVGCRTWDELQVIDAWLVVAEPFVPGPRDRLVVNPLFEEARRHRATFMRAMSHLGIEAAEEATIDRSSIGRKLAAQRWRRHGN